MPRPVTDDVRHHDGARAERGLFDRLGAFAVRRRAVILLASLAFFILSALAAPGLFGRLQGGGLTDPSASSSRARAVLEDQFGQSDPDLVLLVRGPGPVDDPVTAAAGRGLVTRLAGDPRLTDVASYWTTGNAALRSGDEQSSLIVARLTGDADVQKQTVRALEAELIGHTDPLEVLLGGRAAVSDEINTRSRRDLAGAEAIALPLTLLLLVFVFRGVVAATLPLVVGVIAVAGTFLALHAISLATDVSIYSINLTTALGLGLAIDYSLFIVSRFREELADQGAVEPAVIRAVATAGRTVAFSAVTVALSVSALLVFPMYFLRSFAFAGVAVVLIAALASTLTLPALLAMLGHRVNHLSIPGRRGPGGRFWHRLSLVVMRRPVLIAGAVTVALLALGAPFLRVRFGLPDDRVLPASAEVRQVSDTIRADYTGNASESFAVIARGRGGQDLQSDDLDQLTRQLSMLPGVTAAQGPTGTYVAGAVVDAGPPRERIDGSVAWVAVVPNVPLRSAAGEALVNRIRSMPTSPTTAVEGAAAQLVDTKASLARRAPLALTIIAVTTFVLLFAMFGGLVVAAKAIVLNLLSLTATFGAMVVIFQWGRGSSLLGFTPTGTIDASMPILMFCIAFGLSMDYEVFLLSRIKEEHDRTGDNRHAVAVGLERTGSIITAAAALLAVSFIALSSSSIAMLKLFGVGLALAVVMDATIIRGLLVPALMTLAGEANWWAPAPLGRLQQRVGISDHD